MADNIQRYGFRVFKSRSSTAAPMPERLRVASAYQATDVNTTNCDIGPGDVFKKVSDGTVALAAGTDAFAYVCVGLGPYWDGTVMRFNKVIPGASGNYGTNYERETFIYCVPVSHYIFEVDCDTSGSNTTYANYRTLIHNNVNHVNTGDTTNVRANPQLAISGAATTNTLQWRIVDISPSQENADFAGKYVKLLVTANISQEAAGGAGTLTGV